jgi:hypothetical protein
MRYLRLIPFLLIVLPYVAVRTTIDAAKELWHEALER